MRRSRSPRSCSPAAGRDDTAARVFSPPRRLVGTPDIGRRDWTPVPAPRGQAVAAISAGARTHAFVPQDSPGTPAAPASSRGRYASQGHSGPSEWAREAEALASPPAGATRTTRIGLHVGACSTMSAGDASHASRSSWRPLVAESPLEQGFPHLVGTGTFFEAGRGPTGGEVQEGIARDAPGPRGQAGDRSRAQVPVLPRPARSPHRLAVGRPVEAVRSPRPKRRSPVEKTENAGSRRSCTGFGASAASDRTPRRRAGRRRAFRQRDRRRRGAGASWWSSAPPPRSPGSEPSGASGARPTICLRRCWAGSPRASTPRTLGKPEPCSTRSRDVRADRAGTATPTPVPAPVAGMRASGSWPASPRARRSGRRRPGRRRGRPRCTRGSRCRADAPRLP